VRGNPIFGSVELCELLETRHTGGESYQASRATALALRWNNNNNSVFSLNHPKRIRVRKNSRENYMIIGKDFGKNLERCQLRNVKLGRGISGLTVQFVDLYLFHFLFCENVRIHLCRDAVVVAIVISALHLYDAIRCDVYTDAAFEPDSKTGGMVQHFLTAVAFALRGLVFLLMNLRAILLEQTRNIQ
jgi:hypothetical protein